MATDWATLRRLADSQADLLTRAQCLALLDETTYPWRNCVPVRRLLGTAKATTRVFWAEVAVTPCQTAVELATILRSRGWTGQSHRRSRVSVSWGTRSSARRLPVRR